MLAPKLLLFVVSGALGHVLGDVEALRDALGRLPETAGGRAATPDGGSHAQYQLPGLPAPGPSDGFGNRNVAGELKDPSDGFGHVVATGHAGGRLGKSMPDSELAPARVPAPKPKRQVETKPTVLYRGDLRPPSVIQKAGGFTPWGGLDAPDSGNSVYSHMRGSNGAPQDSVYVSTTTDIRIAIEAIGGQGYVYEIQPSENMFSLQSTLGSYEIYPNQKEVVALRGIRADQITRYAKVNSELYWLVRNPRPDFKPFKGYDAAKWRGHSISDGQIALAGLPSGHPALKEDARFMAHAGKPLAGAADDFMRQARAKGWEPPAPSPKGRCVILKRDVTGSPCWDGNNGGDAKAMRDRGEIQAAGLDDAARAAEIKRRAKTYAREEAAKLARKVKLRPRVIQELSAIHDAMGRMKRAASKSLSKIFGTTLGSMATGVALSQLAVDAVNEITTNPDPDNLSTMLASVVPVLGCVAQGANDHKNGRFNGADAGLCVLADVLLLTPLAPMGLLIHAARSIPHVLERFRYGAVHYLLVGRDAYENDLFGYYSQQWHKQRLQVLSMVGSQRGVAYWMALWELQKIRLVDEGADIAGALRAVAQVSDAAEDSTSKADSQPHQGDGSLTSSERVSAKICDTLTEEKTRFIGQIKREIERLFERQYARFHKDFSRHFLEQVNGLDFALRNFNHRWERNDKPGLRPGPEYGAYTSDFMNWLPGQLTTCSGGEPGEPQKYDFYQWSDSNVKALLRSERGYERPGGEVCQPGTVYMRLHDDRYPNVLFQHHRSTDMCVCLGRRRYMVARTWNGCR